MAQHASREFLEEKLASVQAEAEAFHLQADTALKYAEQVWWSWNLRRKRLKIRCVDECILGYGDEDLDRGEAFWWERIHPEDLAELRQSLDQCLNGDQRVWHIEHRMKDVVGDWVWVEQSGFVFRRDAEGKAVEMVGTTRKTHERYQLIDLFKGSEGLIEAMAESAPVSFWLRDTSGRVLLASNAFRETHGNPPRGDEVEDALSADPASEKAWKAAFARAAAGETVVVDLKVKTRKKQARRTVHLIPVFEKKVAFAILEIFSKD